MNGSRLYLSAAAEASLRRLPIDLREVELEPEVLAELVERGIVAPAPIHGRWRDRYGYLTQRGAVYLLALFCRDLEGSLCACGAPYKAHNPVRPHDNPESGCRAFTYAAPLYKPEGP